MSVVYIIFSVRHLFSISQPCRTMEIVACSSFYGLLSVCSGLVCSFLYINPTVWRGVVCLRKWSHSIANGRGSFLCIVLQGVMWVLLVKIWNLSGRVSVIEIGLWSDRVMDSIIVFVR